MTSSAALWEQEVTQCLEVTSWDRGETGSEVGVRAREHVCKLDWCVWCEQEEVAGCTALKNRNILNAS